MKQVPERRVKRLLMHGMEIIAAQQFFKEQSSIFTL
jgi:hypothetical protein